MSLTIPEVDAVLSAAPSAPSARSLRELAEALAAAGPVPAPEAHRALNAAILSAATDSGAPAAAAAAAARACIALVSAVPRAYDALVFDTVVRKVVKFAADDAATARGATKPKGGRRKQKAAAAVAAAVEAGGGGGGGGGGDGDGGDGGDDASLRADDCAAFWPALVALVKAPADDRSGGGFASSAAVGLAGLLRSSTVADQRALVATGFDALLAPGAHGPPQHVVHAAFAALLPVTVAPKLPAATRAALAGVLSAVVHADVRDRAAGDDDGDADATMGGRTPRAQAPGRSRGRRTQAAAGEGDGAVADAAPETTPISSQDAALQKRTSLGFLQACCMRVPERADDRAAVAATLLRLVTCLDSEHVGRYARFLAKLARQSRSLLRVFAAELALALVPTAVAASKGACRPVLQLLIDMFLDRASDKVPAVRAKSIACLTAALENVVAAPGGDGGGPQELVFATAQRLMRPDFDLDARADDPKSGVRKAVVQLVTVLGTGLSAEATRAPHSMLVKFAQVAYDRCEDVVPTVRRCALQSLTALVHVACASSAAPPAREKTCSLLVRLWMDGALPRIVDAESSVQDSCLEAFETLVLTPLITGRQTPTACGGHNVVEAFLRALCGGSSAAGRYTSTAVCLLAAKGAIDLRVVEALQARACDASKGVADPAVDGAWALLAEIIEADVTQAYGKHVDGAAITKAALDGSGGRHACRIAAAIAAEIEAADRARLGRQLFDALSGVAAPSAGGSAAFEMDAVRVMTRALGSFDPDCGGRLLARFDEGLAQNGQEWSECRLMSCLSVVGAVCASFRLTREPPARLVHRVQALMDGRHPQRVRATALATMGNLCICDVAPGGANRRSTTSSAEPAAPGAGDLVSRHVGFGELLARRSISLFVRELNDGASVAARVNALIVLCDLCRRYTSIVEPHLGRLAMCLRDDSDVVRKRALASLTSLLQEDYLKLRGGPLFFRLVLSLLDTTVDIRRSAEYVLQHVLLPKAPMLFATNLVEVMFVLNNCLVHTAYNQFLRTAGETASNARLSAARGERFKAYHWMMARIPVEQRIGIASRLRLDILVPVCDGALSLAVSAVADVVTDALKLLCVKEMCLPAAGGAGRGGPSRAAGDVDDEEDGGGGGGGGGGGDAVAAVAACNRTKAAILAKVYEIELREETLPVLLDLRRRLEAQRSPLLATVGETLCALLRPHRGELGKFIEDSTLRAEVEYDMKQDDAAARDARKGSRAGGGVPKSTSPPPQPSPLQDATNATPSRPRPRTQTPEQEDAEAAADGQMRSQIGGGRLADVLAASPRLGALSASGRKERAAIVFDMDVEDGGSIVEPVAERRRTRSATGLVRALAL